MPNLLVQIIFMLTFVCVYANVKYCKDYSGYVVYCFSPQNNYCQTYRRGPFSFTTCEDTCNTTSSYFCCNSTGCPFYGSWDPSYIIVWSILAPFICCSVCSSCIIVVCAVLARKKRKLNRRQEAIITRQNVPPAQTVDQRVIEMNSIGPDAVYFTNLNELNDPSVSFKPPYTEPRLNTVDDLPNYDDATKAWKPLSPQSIETTGKSETEKQSTEMTSQNA